MLSILSLNETPEQDFFKTKKASELQSQFFTGQLVAYLCRSE